MAKRILVPLDESRVAEMVVPLVAAVARGAGATVRLLLVAPVPQNQIGEGDRVVAKTDQEMARLEAEGLDDLRKVEVQFGSGGDVECVVRFGDPVDESSVKPIVRSRSDRGDHAGTERARTRRAGSVAEEIVRKADAPVMLMRAGRNSR